MFLVKYRFRFDGDHVIIEDDEGYWIGEFTPEIDVKNGKISKFRRGVLSVIAIAFPRHFVEDLFEEGDDITKLKNVLEEYLGKVKEWMEFLKDHPEMKVVSDGYVDFVLKTEIDLGIEIEADNIDRIAEIITPILESLPLYY